jgi:flavin reductase (DIM6/NTAB) family NADH-FMN oxidoreductase RutF
MEQLFEKIRPEAIDDNIFQLIGSDWMLICAGQPEEYNMMTASWGTAGYLWKKPVVFAFVRPQRHTYGFMESNPYFTISFFEEAHREVLNVCGTKSGRDIDKMQLEGLTPLATTKGNVLFEEARLVLECRKIYFDDIRPEMFQAFDIEKIYAAKDYHRFYVGEIVNVWQKKS